MRHFLLTILTLSMGTMSFGKMNLKPSYQWKYLDLVWDSPQQKQEAINSGAYDPRVAYLYDVEKAPDGRVFVTAVRDKGVPVGLMTVTNKQGEGGPLLRPYPDWSWYKNDCKGITGGVYQLDIKCNHLFVVDSGRISFDQLCSPQLLIFDLSTDKLIKRVTIPIELLRNQTLGLLSTASVYAPDCRDVKNNAIVFMADTKGWGLVIYNARTSKICRLNSDFMKITNFTITIDNKDFPFPRGIIMGTYGLTIIGKGLYYTTLPGNKIYKIEYPKLIECSTKDIDEANRRTQLAGALDGLATVLASDRCVIFFNDLTKTSIMCADSSKEINSNKEVVAYDPIQLQYPSGMKVINDELWVLSNRYHIHVGNEILKYNITLNINETNFRVFSMPIKEIQKNTNCFSSCN